MNKAEKLPTGLELLRVPFEANHISKLPKPTKAQTDAVKNDFKKGVRCKICQGWHHPDVVHLDYVGHAALTDRLLDVDPEWSWEPISFDSRGLPALDENGGLWIRLTVCGVTRLGYGDADGKRGGNAIKEAIGDALRNAAMRFGAALDLWHKGDLHLDTPDGGQEHSQEDAVSPAPKQPAHSKLKTELRGWVHELNGCGDADELNAFLKTKDSLRIVKETQEKLPHLWDGSDWPESMNRPEEFVPIADLISKRQAECAKASAEYMTQ